MSASELNSTHKAKYELHKVVVIDAGVISTERHLP